MLSVVNSLVGGRPGRCGGAELTDRLYCLKPESVAWSIEWAKHPAHISLRAYREALSPTLWESLTLLMLVRNPYDRVLSTYNYLYWQTGKRHTHLTELGIGTMGDYIAGLPQEDLDRLEFIRMESYEADIQRLAIKHGWKVRPAAHKNATPSGRKLYKELTTEQRREVTESHTKDFELFGYETG